MQKNNLFFLLNDILGTKNLLEIIKNCKEILDKITANKPAKKPNATSSETVLIGYQPINPSTSLAVELTVFYFNGIAVAITVVNLGR